MWTAMTVVCLLMGGFEYRDGFDYADETEGEPAWYADTVAWEVRGGSMIGEDGAKSFVVLQAAPHGRRVVVEAVVDVERRKGADWAVAGVAVRRDGPNHWHMALVEAPESQGHRHFVELQESLNGAWLATGAPSSKLTCTAQVGRDFDWQYGRPYRIRIAMSPEGIEGTLAEMDGTLRSRIAYTFDNPAVTSGQPALDSGGFVTCFDDVVASVDDVVPAPTEPDTQIKPYTLGGFDTIRADTTGFFYPRQIDGKWWLIDPKGRGFYMVGTDHASYFVHWCEKLGYAPYHKNMQAKHGSEAAWADETADRLKAWGFNTLPANHSRLLRYRHFAHIEFLAWGTAFSSIDDIVPKTTWTGVPNVFSPKWARHCDKQARKQCAPNRKDPWLIGYFIDNELEWYGKIHTTWGVFVEAWKKPAGHSAKQAMVRFVREHVKDVETFNEHWGTNLAGFNALASHTMPGEPTCDAAKKVAHGFLRLLVERYFKIAAEAIRRHDPNHLVLGCRFAGGAPDIWDIAGKHCDIVSLNTYPRIDVGRGVPAHVIRYLRECHEKCNRPMMITEWSFPALDAGLPCKHGAGMRVDTQAQKTQCFVDYQTLLFSLPFMIGSNYFMWADEPALGISKTFPEDSNYGLVNVDGVPYKLLTEACTGLNPRACALHLAGKVQAAIPAKVISWLTAPPTEKIPHQAGVVAFDVSGLRIVVPPESSSGGSMCTFALDGQSLGSLTGMMHQRAGQDMWVRANQATCVAMYRNPDATTLDFELSYTGDGKPITEADDQTGKKAPLRSRAHRFRAGWRVRFPARPVKMPFIASQCLWVENTDSDPWRLVDVFHWIAPEIGGNPANDAPDGPDVPNHYLHAGGWVDRTVGLGIGATYPPGSGYECRYWRDPAGGLHSDLYVKIDEQLTPGRRCEVAAPPVFVFAYRAKDAGALSAAAGEVMPVVLAGGT